MIEVEPATKIADGLAALVLKPGERLVLRYATPLKPEVVQRLKAQLAEFDPRLRVLVLDSSADVLVLRQDGSDAKTS